MSVASRAMAKKGRTALGPLDSNTVPSPLPSLSTLKPPVNTSKSPVRTGSKRPAPDDPGLSDESLVGEPIDKDCNQVRRMINAHIDSGVSKVGDFQRAIGVSSNAYRNFMTQSGPTKGSGSDVYVNALTYFKKRERAGIPLPRQGMSVKKQKTSSDDSPSSKPEPKSTKKDVMDTKKAKQGTEIGDMHLDGEDEDKVEIYDTCSEIRKKISAHLRKEGVTAAGFCRDLDAQWHTDKKSHNIKPNTLQTFRGKKKPLEGNTSAVYYAAYVFFEKMRVKEGKPKSKHRQEMEKRWPHGTDTDRDWHKTGLWAMQGETIEETSYGEVIINGRKAH